MNDANTHSGLLLAFSRLIELHWCQIWFLLFFAMYIVWLHGIYWAHSIEWSNKCFDFAFLKEIIIIFLRNSPIMIKLIDDIALLYLIGRGKKFYLVIFSVPIYWSSDKKGSKVAGVAFSFSSIFSWPAVLMWHSFAPSLFSEPCKPKSNFYLLHRGRSQTTFSRGGGG